jgi:quercetin dioxygenase-like cupin family protein
MKSILYLVLGIATMALAAMLSGGRATAQEPPRPSVKFASVFPVAGSPRQYELVQQVLEFRPGASTYEHTHGGPAFVTVLEGQSTILEAGVERTYGPGQTYSEGQGVALTAMNKSSGTTRVLASFLLSPGAPQTINRLDSPRPAVAAVTTSISRTTLGTLPAEFELRQVVNDFAPGALQPLHSHGGPALAMVIQGEITFEIGETKLRRTAGEFFVENDTSLVHQARNTGTGPATVAITFLIPKGAPMTTFVTAPSQPAPGVGAAGQPEAVSQIRPPATGDGWLLLPHRTNRQSLAATAALVLGFSTLAVGALSMVRRRLT